MVFFGDFGKTVTDLFKKSKYELNKTLKVTAKSENTEWTSESTFPVKAGGSLKTKNTYKQSDKKFGALEVELQTTCAKFDYETPKLVDGLKTNVVVEYPNVSLKGKYAPKDTMAKGKATVKCDSTDTSKASVSAEVSAELQPNLFLGGELKYSNAKGMQDYSVGAHYVKGDTQLTLKTGNNFDSVHAQLYKKYSDCGEVAADYDMDLNSYAPTCTVGGKLKLDGGKSHVQGCVKSDGLVYMLYKHQLSDRLAGTVGTTFNIQNVDAINLHYKFEFEA